MKDDSLNKHVLQPVNPSDPAVRAESSENGESQDLAESSGSRDGAETARLRDPQCQRVLDEQGYLILGGTRAIETGTVLPGANGGDGFSRVPGPLVCIGGATFQEWQNQVERFLGRRPNRGHYTHFCKVIAE